MTTSVDDGVIEVGVAGDVLPGTSVLVVVAELESVRVANGATVSLIGELDLPVFEASASAGSSVLASEVRSGASGGIWELAANGASTVDLSAIPVSAVDLEVTGGSRVTIDVLTSVLGVVEAGSTLEVIGDPGHLEVTGGGTVRAMGPRETGESAPEPAVAARPDGLTGAPLPPPDTAVVAFDEERFFSGAGTFPALTDPVVVAASEATSLRGRDARPRSDAERRGARLPDLPAAVPPRVERRPRWEAVPRHLLNRLLIRGRVRPPRRKHPWGKRRRRPAPLPHRRHLQRRLHHVGRPHRQCLVASRWTRD